MEIRENIVDRIKKQTSEGKLKCEGITHKQTKHELVGFLSHGNFPLALAKPLVLLGLCGLAHCDLSRWKCIMSVNIR